MGWVAPAIMLGTAVAGALSNRGRKETTSGQSTTGATQQSNSSSTANTSSNTVNRGTTASRGTTATTGTQLSSGSGTTASSILPQFAVEGQPLLSSLTQRYLQLAEQSPNAADIGNAGVRQANASAEMRKKAINNILAQRGLYNSPAGAFGEIAAESGRVSDVVRARSEAPFQAQQLLAQNLGQASNFLQNFRGQSQTGQTTQQSETTSVQNAINEIFQTSRNEQEMQSRLEELANSYGINSQTTNQTGTVTAPGNVAGGAATGGSSALALLLALGQVGKKPPGVG